MRIELKRGNGWGFCFGSVLQMFVLGGLVLGLLAAGRAQTTHTWSGAVSSDFSNADNWSAGGVPPAGGSGRISVQNAFDKFPLYFTASQETHIVTTTDRGLFIASGGTGSAMFITGGTFDSRASTADGISNGPDGDLTIAGGAYINTNGGSSTFLVKYGGSGTGTLTIDSGSFTTGILQFGHDPGGSGVVHLNRGVLNARQILKVNTPYATFNFNGGTLVAGAASTAFMEGLNLANVRDGGAVIDTNGFDITIGQALLHSDNEDDAAIDGGLTKLGSGRLTLSGVNTYTGDTVIEGGTLLLNHSLALRHSPLSYDNQGGTLDFGTLTAATIGGLNGAQNLPASSLTALTLNPRDGLEVEYSGIINDGGGGLELIKTGAGTQILTGANTYTGETKVNSGVLRITNAGALGSTAVGTTVANGARLELSGGITVTGESITISGQGGNSFGALQSYSGANTWAGNVTLGANNTRVGANGVGNNLTISGVIDDGPNSYTLAVRGSTGNSTTILSGANTYGGGTDIVVGVLQIAGGHDRLPTGTVLRIGNTSNVASATFDLNGFNQQVAGLSDLVGATGTPMTRTVTNSSATLSTLTVNNASDYTYAGTITENLALAKNGGGTLTLSGENTFTGETVVNAGTLELDHSLALQYSPLNYDNQGGTIDFGTLTAATIGGLNGAQDLPASSLTALTLNPGGGVTATYSGGINDGGGGLELIKTGGGTQILTGANAYTRETKLNSGVLRITNAGALGTTDGPVTVASGARLELAGSITVVGQPITIAGTGGNNFGALQSFSGANTWTGDVTLGSSGARIGANGVDQSLTVSGVIGDGGTDRNLAVRNADAGGTTILSGVNTYGGETHVVVGLLQIAGGDDRLPTGTVLRIGNTANVRTATFDLNGFNQQVAGLTDDGTSMTRTVTNSSGTLATLTVNNASNYTYEGTITENLALTKDGAARLTLSGDNSFTGQTVIEGGTLRLDHPLALQSSPLNYDNQGGAVDFGSFTSVTLGGLKGGQGLPMSGLNELVLNPVAGAVVTYAGVIDDGAGGLTLTKSGAGTQILTGENSYTGTTTISSGTLQVGAGGTAGSLGSGDIVNHGALVVHRSDEVTFDQVISGSGSLIKEGDNTLILTGSHSYSGGTIIDGGRLLVQDTGRLANSSKVTVAEDAILELSTGSWLYGGTISGAGGLTKSGSGGDVRLTGTNTYTGPTLVTGSRTLRAGSAQAFGIGSALTIDSGATVELNRWSLAVGSLSGGGTIRNASVTFYTPGLGTPTILTVGGDDTSTLFSGVIEDGSQSNVPEADRVPVGLTKVGAGILTLTGANTYTGDTVISGGTLEVGAGGGTGALGSGNIVNDAALVVNRTGTLTLAQDISGTGTLTKLGSGTLVLSGNNTYKGETTVSGGAIRVTSDGALGDTAGITMVAEGARVELSGEVTVSGQTIRIGGDGASGSTGALRTIDGYNVWDGPVFLDGPGGMTGARVGAVNAGSVLEISGVIQDGTQNEVMVRNDQGTTVFSGANEYTGETHVYNGTLALGANDSLPVGNPLRLGIHSLHATFDLSGFHQTIGTLRSDGYQDGSRTITNTGGSESTLTVIQNSNQIFDGVITNDANALHLIKAGGSRLTLTGDSNYTGTTTITAGTLALSHESNNNISGSPLVQVGPGATLDVTGLAGGTFNVAGGQTLGGSGTVAGAVDVLDGATLAPGMSIGTLNLTGDLALYDGAAWDWEFLNNEPDNYDQVSGPTLILPTESDSLITLNILGLPGHSVNWYDEFVLFTGQVENFDAGLFDLVNDSDWSRGWAISVGNSLILTAVPEPGTWLMLMCVLACGLLARRRR